jgi:hypothetical protein
MFLSSDGVSNHTPVIGWMAWGLVLGAMFALEGLSLAKPGSGLPSFSDMFRAISSPLWGRWMLFAGWLWLGWHLFIRGWQFFLRGPTPGAPPLMPGGTLSASAALTQIVAPMLALYALAMALLIGFGHRRRAGRPAVRGGPLGLLTHIAVTAVPGFALFVAVNAPLAAAGIIHGTLSQAIREGAVLDFVIVIPGLLLVTAFAQALAGRRGADPAGRA